MSTSGGRAHCPKRSNNFLVFGAPASLIGSELPWLTGSGPSLCPGPMLQGQPALTFVDSGGRHPRVPQFPSRLLSFPSRLLSNHKPLHENHSIAVYPLALLGTTISVSLSRCAPRFPPSEDQRTGFSLAISRPDALSPSSATLEQVAV